MFKITDLRPYSLITSPFDWVDYNPIRFTKKQNVLFQAYGMNSTNAIGD
jgi:hypothetical protein